jgi:hypothetical protein
MEASVKKFRLPFMTVGADTTTGTPFPMIGWIEADDVARIGFDIELRSKTGNLEVALGYQTADSENSPDAAVAVTSFVSANGFTFRGSLDDISATTAGKRLIRPVVIARLTSGTTLAIGCVGGNMYVVKRA